LQLGRLFSYLFDDVSKKFVEPFLIKRNLILFDKLFEILSKLEIIRLVDQVRFKTENVPFGEVAIEFVIAS
jgi:hypothetical protein